MTATQQGGVQLWRERATPLAAYEYRSDSLVRLNNGKLLYMYGTGTTIRQSIMPDTSVKLFAENGSVVARRESDTLVSQHLGDRMDNNLPPIAATAFRNQHGLFYVVARQITYDNVSPFTRRIALQLFKSASGNADDWALYATIRQASQSWTGGGVNYIGLNLPHCGVPYVAPSGRMVLSGPHADPATVNSVQFVGGIFTSDDGGLTWATRARFGVGAGGGAYINTIARNVFEKDGRLFTVFAGNYTEPLLYVPRSLDGGNTWSIGASMPSAQGWQLYDEFQKKHYIVYGSGNNSLTSSVRENLNPDINPPQLGPTIINLPPTDVQFAYGRSVIQQRVDDETVVMWNGQVLLTSEFPDVVPPLRLASRDDQNKYGAPRFRQMSTSKQFGEQRIATPNTYW